MLKQYNLSSVCKSYQIFPNLNEFFSSKRIFSWELCQLILFELKSLKLFKPKSSIFFSKFNISEGPDPECDKKCANQGWCNHEKICQCPEGYMGQYCRTALCYPQCMNGGNCTSPGVCSCPAGFQGLHCEGGEVILFLNNFPL